MYISIIYVYELKFLILKIMRNYSMIEIRTNFKYGMLENYFLNNSVSDKRNINNNEIVQQSMKCYSIVI